MASTLPMEELWTAMTCRGECVVADDGEQTEPFACVAVAATGDANEAEDDALVAGPPGRLAPVLRISPVG